MKTAEQIELRLRWLKGELAMALKHLERAAGQERASILQKVVELEDEIARGLALLEKRP